MKPRTDQLRFMSAANGETILDAYLEAAEKGGRALGDILSDIFDSDGTFRTDLFQFREDPDNAGIFQFRVGDFVDPDAGWEDMSETDFNTFIEACEDARDAAATSATAAASSASAASTSASTATTQATNASSSASAASTSASNASTSATNAASSASSASTSASTATTKAAEAAASAAAAAQSAIDAQDAADSISSGPVTSVNGHTGIVTGLAETSDIGVTIQAHDADLDALATAGSGTNKLPYYSATATAALADFTAFARTLLDDADASTALTTLGITTFIKTLLDDANQAAARTTLGLTPGTDVQAYSAVLAAVAALTMTNDNFLQIKSGAISGRTVAQVITDLIAGNLFDTRALATPTLNNAITVESSANNSSTNFAIDLANGTLQIITLTGNWVPNTGWPTAAAGQFFRLIVKQDGTGSRTITWPSSVKWPSSTAPTITATASKADIFDFSSDGTNWYGINSGQLYL